MGHAEKIIGRHETENKILIFLRMEYNIDI